LWNENLREHKSIYPRGGHGISWQGKNRKKTKKSKRKTSPTQVYLLLKPGCRLDFMFMNQLRNVPLQLVLPFETRMQDKRGGTLPVWSGHMWLRGWRGLPCANLGKNLIYKKCDLNCLYERDFVTLAYLLWVLNVMSRPFLLSI